ncbi:hypothetical protein GN956_G17639 [Arapaima gigas]
MDTVAVIVEESDSRPRRPPHGNTDNNTHLNRGASPTQPPTNNPSVWAETEGTSARRGPISAFVLPAGAGDWSRATSAALQDRRVNPEQVEPAGEKASQVSPRIRLRPVDA